MQEQTNSVDQWIDRYCQTHRVHALRRPALRLLMGEFADGAIAAASVAGLHNRPVIVSGYLQRLYEHRSRSLKQGSWQLEVLAWMAHDRQFAMDVSRQAAE